MLTDKATLVTPSCLVLWPHLVKPDYYEGALEYKANLILDPKDPKAAKLISDIKDTAQEEYELAIALLMEGDGKSKALSKEIKAKVPMEPEYDDNGDDTGRMILKVKSKAEGIYKDKPWKREIPLFDSSNKDVTGAIDSIWGGSTLKLELVVNRYFAKGLKLAGLSFYIKAVQIINLKSGSGGTGLSGFGVEEGGYTAPEAAPLLESSFDVGMEEPDF